MIQVVSRAFDVLRCFEGHEARLGNLEISNRCGLPRSTVSRLTHTLTRMGQLVYLPRDQKYRIGPSAVAMSTSMMKGLQLRNLIRLRLQDVAEQLPGTVGFVIPDRFHLVYLEFARAPNALGLHEVTGSRIAMTSTAAGHAYTAALDDDVGDALIAEMEREIPDDAELLKSRIEGNRAICASTAMSWPAALWSPHINGLAVPMWSPQYQTFVVVTIGLLAAMYRREAAAQGSRAADARTGRCDRRPARRRRRRHLREPAGTESRFRCQPITITKSSRRRIRMNWKPELDDLARREAFAREMGGVDKVKRQHDQGRLTVRERIDKLIDQNSFHEIGAISGIAEYDENSELKDLTPANCVFGRGKIDGRTVVVVGDDFTVRGGSADASISAKPLMAEEMAHDFRLPIIRVIEGSGGGGSVKTIETKGAANLPGGVGGTRWYWYTTANMARVPVVGLGLGSVAGLGAARLAASHYSVMTKSSAMFVAGPPVVKRLGQDLTKQELGGADIQTRAGGVDHAVDTEEEAFDCARRFLSYLPSSVYELPPTTPCDDDPERAEESLMKAVPRNRRQVYKMRPIIDAVVDKGSFFEMGANFGRPIITGLARLEGRAVLLLASDPFHYGGSWTAEACQKVVRCVDLAETFHLPVVYLMDCPGFMIGLEAEKAATIRHGVRAMAAVNQTTVPWCTIIVRNAFGVAGVVHQPANRYSMRYAWPSAYWGSLPLEGGIEAAYRADIDAADDPAAKLKEIEDRLNKLRSPFRSAEKFWVEEIIDPRKTRSLLCEFARLAEPLRTPGPATNMAIRP